VRGVECDRVVHVPILTGLRTTIAATPRATGIARLKPSHSVLSDVARGFSPATTRP
jgi:hypothetical protein